MQGFDQVCCFAGAGIAIGLGVVGSALGEGYAAAKAANAISRQPLAGVSIMNTMLIGQAVTESAAVFALLISIILLFHSTGPGFIEGIKYLSAGICIGLGTLGPGLGSGQPVGAACEGIARNPERVNILILTMLIGQSVAQTTVIFSLVVALIFIFVI